MILRAAQEDHTDWGEELVMRRFMIALAASALLTACGAAAANDREVASLSTAGVDDAPSDSTATSDATDTTGVTDPGEAALQFAKCMREHGIDMPDPQVSDEGGVMVAVGGPGQDGADAPDPKDFEAANKECQHFMQDVVAGFDPPSEEDQKKMQEQALAFAKCMRDHGIDMPDPQFGDGDGTFSISLGGPNAGASDDGPQIDPTSDEFKAASEACGQAGGGFVFSSSKPADG